MAVKPLTLLSEGEEGKVAEIQSGYSLKHRLTELGFDKGSEVRVIKMGAPGPVIVEVKGCCRLVLGMGEASKIMVETGE